MMWRVCLVLSVLFGLAAPVVQASSYVVPDVTVIAEADNAVKAKDAAIQKAQRMAFAQLIGKQEVDIAAIGDKDITRLVSGFSLKNERVTSKSYSASFTIRFEPNRTQFFIQQQGFDLVDPTMLADAEEGAGIRLDADQTMLDTGVLLLPVLDIGSRRVLWDDPNPWRQVWQKRDYSMTGLSLRVPLGDIDDIRDVPDAEFLTGGRADIGQMLRRYGVNTLYVAVAKNQGPALDPSGGMVVSLYRHDGNRLGFVRKTILHPRPGYAFDDAVPAAVQMIVMAENNKTAHEEPVLAEEGEGTNLFDSPAETETASIPAEEPPPLHGSLVVTVPYQSFAQWVDIQKRLRRVAGVQNILPIRVSPSSAQVELVTGISMAALAQNAAAQGFDLQTMPSGEMALIER